MGNIPIDYSVIPKGNESEKIKEIALQEGFKRYELSVGPGTKNGDNYMGAIFQVQINGVDTNNQPKVLDLILKCSERDERYRDCTANGMNTLWFRREIQMYTVVLPKFFEMQSKAAITNGFFPCAKIYGSSEKVMDEFIIMENKKVKGYEMKNRLEPLNIDHCKLVLKQLGYLHAFSLALKELNPQIHKSMSEAYPDVTIEQLLNSQLAKVFDTQLVEKSKQALETLNLNTEQDIHEKFLKFTNESRDKLKSLTIPNSNDEYFVMIHGDCWTNNLLFKYGDFKNEGKPTEVCFIDWQTSKWASPAIDLSYFIYNCVAEEVYQKHFDSLIKYYYESASLMLRQLGVDPVKVYPFSALEIQIQKYFYYGVIISVITLSIILRDSQEIPNAVELLEEGGEEKLCNKSKNHDQYVKRVRGVLLHAASKNFF